MAPRPTRYDVNDSFDTRNNKIDNVDDLVLDLDASSMFLDKMHGFYLTR